MHDIRIALWGADWKAELDATAALICKEGGRICMRGRTTDREAIWLKCEFVDEGERDRIRDLAFKLAITRRVVIEI